MARYVTLREGGKHALATFHNVSIISRVLLRTLSVICLVCIVYFSFSIVAAYMANKVVY